MGINIKYTTLVFESDTAEKIKKVREFAKHPFCRAWSLDHEITRLELIEEALDDGDIELAKEYIRLVDCTRALTKPKK